jgi:hypothetical protein
VKRSISAVLVVGAITGVVLWFFLRRDARTDALAVREEATQRLAEYLAQKYPGGRAMIVSNPLDLENKLC